jgi:uncharacterized protein (DUF111 family)
MRKVLRTLDANNCVVTGKKPDHEITEASYEIGKKDLQKNLTLRSLGADKKSKKTRSFRHGLSGAPHNL